MITILKMRRKYGKVSLLNPPIYFDLSQPQSDPLSQVMTELQIVTNILGWTVILQLCRAVTTDCNGSLKMLIRNEPEQKTKSNQKRCHQVP